MRLNVFLSRSGIASRRKADELIKAGRVTVDGRPGELHTTVGEDSRVELDGVSVRRQRLATVLMHKPAGVVTTASDPQGRPTVLDIVRHTSRLLPVGRLDLDTSGALLLTNDGQLAYRLSHPRFGVEKVYEADVDGALDDRTLRHLARGIELDDGPTAPARVRRLARSRIEIVLHEGRNRQVRRMLEATGHPVRSLRRTSYAGLTLGRLGSGEWRELNATELRRLHLLTQTSGEQQAARTTRTRRSSRG